MTSGHLLTMAGCAAIVVSALLNSQTLSQDSPVNSRPRRVQLRAGLLTDRLSARDLERWQNISRLALAENESGQPLRPTLSRLWKWAEMAPHAIYVELITNPRNASCTAGNFQIERFDPTGEHHQALIRLHLANIDLAWMGENSRRDNGFIPFKGLKKEERYAEVLSHELAHAQQILSDLDKARKVEEVIEQTNEMILSIQRKHSASILDDQLRKRLKARDAFLQELEAHAESIEEIVWQELIYSKKPNGKEGKELFAASRLR